MPTLKRKLIHPLQWILEPLTAEPTFLQKKMFGCEAAYFRGQLCLVLAAGEEPWNGVLVCTSKEFHASLISAFKHLQPHSVLGKWLYISQASPEFEEVVTLLVQLVLRGDPRLGVESKPKRKSRKKKKK